jgi:hypothetical protein
MKEWKYPIEVFNVDKTPNKQEIFQELQSDTGGTRRIGQIPR